MFKHHKKALVIGAGSGRDIASSLLVAEELRQKGTRVDLGGFLTPWALHRFDGMLEKPINRLPSRSIKFIPGHENKPMSCYFEPELGRLFEGRVYLFSLQYGTATLAQELGELVKRESYDLVVAVDTGGDIFARHTDLPRLLTPIIDLSCLEILAKLKVDTALAVIAPGVDGEISHQDLTEIFEELERKNPVLGFHEIKEESFAYRRFVEVKRALDRISHSHTCDMIERIVRENPQADIEEDYRKMYGIEKRYWEVKFPVKLLRDLVSRIFYFDLKGIKALRSDIPIQYETVLDAFVQLKRMGAGGTEVDMSYVPMSCKNGQYTPPVFLLSACSRTREKDKEEMYGYGVQMVAEGKIQRALVVDRTARDLAIQLNLRVSEHAGFWLVEN